LSKGVMRMRSPCCPRSDRGRTPLAVHPLKPMLIVPVRMPATMPSNLFHAPIQDAIDCQDGGCTRFLRSDPTSPGRIPDNIHIIITLCQNRKAEVVIVS
jgi:hypothetical protein